MINTMVGLTSETPTVARVSYLSYSGVARNGNRRPYCASRKGTMYLDCFPALNNVEARVGSNSSASTTRENWANASDTGKLDNLKIRRVVTIHNEPRNLKLPSAYPVFQHDMCVCSWRL